MPELHKKSMRMMRRIIFYKLNLVQLQKVVQKMYICMIGVNRVSKDKSRKV